MLLMAEGGGLSRGADRHQAVDAPDGVASYVLRGHLEGDPKRARIGLRGTARVSGDWTVLGYLLLRRPFAALREWCGC